MSGRDSKLPGIAPTSDSSTTPLNTTSATWRRLKKSSRRGGGHLATAPSVSSQAATSTITGHANRLKPIPSSTQWWNFSGVSGMRDNTHAASSTTASTLQYRIAGPMPGPQAARIQRSAGISTTRVMLALSASRSNGVARTVSALPCGRVSSRPRR